jgi:two-component system, NarL family, sensor histidine kinase DegS
MSTVTARLPGPLRLRRRRAASRRRVGRFVYRFRLRLHDRRFWVVQALVISITLAHTLLEATRHLGLLPDLALLPVSTYFIPVVYAALNFGVEGAVPTALWSAVLTVPNLILWHSGAERPGVVLQLALLVAIAYVIARRVEFETAAKEHAEAANDRLTRLNSDLSLAQATLQEYVRLATDAQEEERKRLARELHDDTIQTLAMAKADLAALRTEESVSRSVHERLHTIDAALARAIDEVRRFSRDLRPSLLDDLGLVHAVDWLVADVGTRTGMKSELHVGGDARRLTPSDELALFRIVQEALHNVERHSAATEVRVRMEFGDKVRAVVADNGRGFDTSRMFDGRKSSGKLGMLGMRERAKLAGATLAIRSRPSLGTRVVVTLAAAEPAEAVAGSGI